MERLKTLDITKNAKRLIKYGLIGLIALSTAVGGAAFNYQHRNDSISLNNAKVNGTMISVRVLTDGRIKELTKSDGDEVKAGEVIAKIEVSVTDEQIEQLEKAVDLAKQNYAKLEVGQMVKVPVRKPKVKTVQIPTTPSIQSRPSRSGSKSSASLEALKERKSRMELLYEMGAISRKELEEAIKEYNSAKAAAGSSSTVSESVQSVPQYSTSTEIEYETEYVEQLQPTPPEILKGAQLAIKQAELSLNVAKQEAQQTEVLAPVNGTIYYGVEVDEEVKAGDVISRIGDSSELWIEAAVTESQFDKIPLGKLVSYVIDGNKLTGTVIEKKAPEPEEETVEVEETKMESPTPADPTQVTPESVPAENNNTSNVPENSSTSMITNNQYNGVGGPEPENKSEAPSTTAETPSNSTTLQSGEAPQAAENTSNESEAKKSAKFSDGVNPDYKDKYIIKISLPVERNFECRPNMNVSINIRDIR